MTTAKPSSLNLNHGELLASGVIDFTGTLGQIAQQLIQYGVSPVKAYRIARNSTQATTTASFDDFDIGSDSSG